MSDDGSRLALGGIEEDALVFQGHVRVYEWNATAGDWKQLGADFTADKAEDYFGMSVSLSADGTHVAIGAKNHDSDSEDTKSNIGQVKVYRYNDTSGSWQQLGEDIDGKEQDEKSGTAVSLSADGTRVAIGAPDYDDENTLNTGRVTVYQYDPATNWTLVAVTEQPDGITDEASGDFSGVSVSISDDGERVAVGSSENGNGAGHVRVYSLVANPPPPPPPSPPPPSPPPPSPPPPPPPPSPPPPNPHRRVLHRRVLHRRVRRRRVRRRLCRRLLVPPPPSSPPPLSPSPPPPPPPFPPVDLSNVNDIEDQRDKVAENLKSAKADAEIARDSLLSGISGDDRTRALLLADAIIAGKNITRVTVTQDAVNAAIACDDVYKLMEVDRSIGSCQASIASGRRKLLADFSVNVLLSTVQIDQSKIDSSVAKLPGATASRVERPEVELSNIPGIDANSDGFTRLIRLADHAVELSKQLEISKAA